MLKTLTSLHFLGSNWFSILAKVKYLLVEMFLTSKLTKIYEFFKNKLILGSQCHLLIIFTIVHYVLQSCHTLRISFVTGRTDKLGSFYSFCMTLRDQFRIEKLLELIFLHMKCPMQYLNIQFSHISLILLKVAFSPDPRLPSYIPSINHFNVLGREIYYMKSK